MIELELIDSVDIISKDTNYPLVRANVDSTIDSCHEVLHERVLPLIGFLKSSLKSNRLRRMLAPSTLNVVDLSFGDVSHNSLLQFFIGLSSLQYDFIFLSLLGIIQADVAEEVFRVQVVFEEVKHVLHSFVPVDNRIVFCVHNKHYGASYNVVMT